MLTLAACHDDSEELKNKKADNDTAIGQQSTSKAVYIRLNFNIPGRSQYTRSGLTGSTDKGIEAEYDFKEGILVIFENDATHPENEGLAKINSAYRIPMLSEPEFDPENVGRSTYVVALSRSKVEELKVTDMKAAVILNPNGQFYVSNNDLYTSDNSKFTGTFDDFCNIIVDDYGNETTGFFMTNAPMLTKGGGATDAEPYTLAPVKAIFFTSAAAAAAESDEITSIIVERAAVKVTLKLGTTPLQPIYINGDDTKKVKLASVKWTIDNYNRAFYLVRHIRTDWNEIKAPFAKAGYRFIYPITTNGYYRSQWAIDINYDNYTGNHLGTSGTDSWNTLAKPTDEIDQPGAAPNYRYLSGVCNASDITNDCTVGGNSLYVAENTVSERCLTWYNTTRVVLSVTLTDNDDKPMTSFYMAAPTGMNNIYTTETELRKAMADWFDDQSSLYPGFVEFSTKAGSDVFSTTAVTINEDPITHILTFVFDKAAPVFNAIDPAQLDTELALLNTLIGTNCYRYDTYMYYASYIAHFGTKDTPWNRETYAPFTTTDTQTYKNTYYHHTSTSGPWDDTDLRANFFGRWSIVRDHWYEITLHSISHAGSPTVPNPVPDESDDQVNNPLTIVPGFPINYVGETPQW